MRLDTRQRALVETHRWGALVYAEDKMRKGLKRNKCPCGHLQRKAREERGCFPQMAAKDVLLATLSACGVTGQTSQWGKVKSGVGALLSSTAD